MDSDRVVEELGDDINIDDILQSVPWAQIPNIKKIKLFVIKKDSRNDLPIPNEKMHYLTETAGTTCTMREGFPLAHTGHTEEAETVKYIEPDYVNEMELPLTNEVTIDPKQMRCPLIDLETAEMSDKRSVVALDSCVSGGLGFQTVDTKAYQRNDVALVDVEGDRVVEVAESGHVVKFPEGDHDIVPQIVLKPLLMLENKGTEFANKISTIDDTEEKLGSIVCRTQGRLLNSDASLGKLSTMCPLCFKAIPSKMNLHKHLLWHLLVKNANNKQFVDPLAEEEFSSDWLSVENKSFEELLNECKQHLKSSDGISCMLCFKNFEFHYDITQLIDLVDFSVPPKCVKCLEQFNETSSLEIHVKQHLGSKPFGCCVCCKIFEDVSEVKLHMDSHIFHTYGKVFQCRYCPKLSFTEEDNRDHELCHVNASNIWKFSPKLTGQEVARGQNETAVDHCFNSIYSYVFNFEKKLTNCGSAFEVVDEMSKFNKLEKSSCNEKLLLEGELRALTSVINLTKEIGELLSEGQSTSRGSDVFSDINGQLIAYDQVLSSSYGSILSNLHKKKIWCNYCRQSFPDLEELSSHKAKYHETHRIFSCEDCPGEFDSMDSLFEHRNTHGKVHLHMCPMCDTHFNYKFDVTQHLKVHFAAILRRCPECGIQYKFHSQLADHMQTHIEIIPFLYKCKACNVFFTGNDQLTKHTLRVHSVERLYECSVCGKRFFKQNVWLLHVKSHIRNKFRKSLKGMDLYKPCKWSKKKVFNVKSM
ncbi:zinc finger protein 431-like [Macrobrachium nipponense]|uniref:zinc finger protein 431-like n=1 Tax=Macrobrachium nipponense TaxID=159736 RepID=UPI0030C8C3AE